MASGTTVRPNPRNALLARDEEMALIRRWQETSDRRAIDRLIGAYQRLVGKLARRFARFGPSYDDLVQEGNVALLEAAGRFDTARGVRFATYAIWWVRAGMQDHVLRNWSIVRLGSTREARSLFFKLRHLQARAAAGGGVPRGDGDVLDRAAAMLKADRTSVGRMDSVLRSGDLSLNAALPQSEDEIATLLADDRPGPEAQVMAAEAARLRAQALAQALAALSPRERGIVVARQLSDEAPTLKSLGAGLGVTTERVRQIERAALGKMRAAMAGSRHACHGALFDDDLAGQPPRPMQAAWSAGLRS